MKALLDTNIVIHREAYKASHLMIGQLFRWLDQLKYTKCIHPITEKEINWHKNQGTTDSMAIKLEAYYALKTIAPTNDRVQNIIDNQDKTENDINDSLLLNEVVEDRVDLFITEDRKIHRKAASLGIENRVFTISHFVEKCISEHPDLVNYKVLSVQKLHFGDIKVVDQFFNSFRNDYPEFDKWFARKSDEIAYVSFFKDTLIGFLYVKVEGSDENYSDINPLFPKKKRLKIGTFKVAINGYRIGERFLKIIFDNALVNNVDEIYVTIFENTPEQIRLIELLEEWGFYDYGTKTSSGKTEKVFCRAFSRVADRINPKLTFPFMSTASNIFFVPIWEAYHTELLPDSILNTESPENYKDSQPHRNALSKVYISHSRERGLASGDIILFYRTGGKYAGVVTTLGIVEKVHNNIESPEALFKICRKKTFFTTDELLKFWGRYKDIKPFVVEFIYAYSFPKRPNLTRLIELGIVKDIMSVPRGFAGITKDQLHLILKESKSNESLIVD